MVAVVVAPPLLPQALGPIPPRPERIDPQRKPLLPVPSWRQKKTSKTRRPTTTGDTLVRRHHPFRWWRLLLGSFSSSRAPLWGEVEKDGHTLVEWLQELNDEGCRWPHWFDDWYDDEVDRQHSLPHRRRWRHRIVEAVQRRGVPLHFHDRIRGGSSSYGFLSLPPARCPRGLRISTPGKTPLHHHPWRRWWKKKRTNSQETTSLHTISLLDRLLLLRGGGGDDGLYGRYPRSLARVLVR